MTNPKSEIRNPRESRSPKPEGPRRWKPLGNFQFSIFNFQFLLPLFLAASLTSPAQVPEKMSFQGRVTASGTNFAGTGQFKFALVSPGVNMSYSATATATVNSGFITAIIVTDGGAGYTTAPAVTITDPTGSNAVVTAHVTGGTVTSITVNPGGNGSGYSASPTVTVDAPPPSLVYDTHWSNDGTSVKGSEPTAAVPVSVAAGLFTVYLGDTNLPNMVALPAKAFNKAETPRLRVWFSDGVNPFATLGADQLLGAAGYAMMAARVAAGSIGDSELANGAVTTDKLDWEAVTTVTLANNSVTTDKIANGTIVNADISASAAIADTKLGTISTAGKVDNSALSASVSLLGPTIESAEITDGTIVNADLSTSAAIADTKLATLATAGKVANSATTATSTNLPNAIVARDAFGSFSAGTVTATAFAGNGAALTNLTALNASQLTTGTVPEARLAASVARTNQVWLLGGNAGTAPGVNFIGPSDNQPLEFKVNNQRALRLEPHPTSPNVVGGHPGNVVDSGIAGATIAGGGAAGYVNRVAGYSGFIGGGGGNTIHSNSSSSVIGGGDGNTLEPDNYVAAILGGLNNKIGTNSDYASIGGGRQNAIRPNASASVIGGGRVNQIEDNAQYATIPGGYGNRATNYAFAAGNRAKAVHSGSFVWADSQTADFASTDANQFLIRASGGVGIGTASPTAALEVAGTIKADAIVASTLDTGDSQPLELRVNGLRGLRIEDNGDGKDTGTTPDEAPNFIGGSPVNSVAAGVVGATVAGGGAGNYGGLAFTNRVEADFGTVSGGIRNTIQPNATSATLGGGEGNTIQPNASQSTIGGGGYNTIQTYADDATIGGGYNNTIQTNASNATIGGGLDNTIQTNAGNATIGGGDYNIIETNAQYATIGGGHGNTVQTDTWGGTIAGGSGNTIAEQSECSSIAGGISNDIGIRSPYSTIGGGDRNTIVGNTDRGTIAGGTENTIEASARWSTIGGGFDNTILANATCATIPGGRENIATDHAFAAGYRAKANHTGAFVWGDSSDADILSTTTNSVTMRASGGYRLFSNSGATVGASLAAGSGTWTSMSDRNAKEALEPVNAQEVLNKVAALPLSTWKYKSQDASVRHIGPMAQDFKAAFAVGETDTGITTIDADGVALAAIQGLNQKVEGEVSQLRAENAELKQAVAELKRIVQQLTK